jgi:hypothetical protein
MYKRLANGMPKRIPKGLTNTRDVAEYKHDTLPWVIVPEHSCKATSSSNFHTNHPQRAQSKRSQPVIVAKLKQPAKSSADFQSRPHASPPVHANPSKPQPTKKVGARRMSSLPSHIPDVAASISHSKTRHKASTRCQEEKSKHRRRQRNPNTTPSGRSQHRWRHHRTSKLDRAFALG